MAKRGGVQPTTTGSSRPILVATIAGTVLLATAGCDAVTQPGDNSAAPTGQPASDGKGIGVPGKPAADPASTQGFGSGAHATPAQRQWLAQTTAFMNRPEQQRDVQIALRARAETHPHFCPAATFEPKRIDIAFDPPPQFAPDGALTRGTIVYRATMRDCAEPVLLTVYLDAMPGTPLRFRAALAGTTFADPDLQERAIPHAANAAKAMLPGCGRVVPIDTRLIGGSPSAGGALVPWSEYWLMSGCGKLVSTKLNFTPDRVANRMLVQADPNATRMLRTAAAPGASLGDAIADAGDGAPAAQASGANASGKVVASAVGTSMSPLGGAVIPGAKVAGTCLMRLHEAAAATAPDHVECLSGLPAQAGASTVCTAARGVAKGQMTVAITEVDTAANTVKFQCTVRAR